jgi:5-methylcytosine-specific restriction endonuclease McrA
MGLMPAAVRSAALESSVLVLNRLYVAIHIVNVRRAFTLLAKELAEVVSVEDGQWVSYDFASWQEVSAHRRSFKEPDQDWLRTFRCEIQVPRIVRLLAFDRMPRPAVKFNRRNLFARDENRCQYCGRKFALSELSLDHVLPRSQGGATSWENVVCACVACNVRKGGRTPDQARMKLFRKPFRPKTSPLVSIKLGHAKYQSWKAFLDHAYWNVELK